MNSIAFGLHKTEAYKIHNDLIKGISSPEIQLLMADSLTNSPYRNRQVIEELQNSDAFRFHCARIDTSVGISATPKFSTGVKFRDIFYLGNNQFNEHELWIHFTWDPVTFQIIHRSISVLHYTIPSRKVWDRRIWYNTEIYDGLEK